jgi:hypothetical protein
VKQRIFKWLEDHDIGTSMVHVYTQDEWRERNEPYGNDAAYTITMEGDLYTIMNYPAGPEDVRLSQEFVAFLASIGFAYEMGFAWSIHLYPEEPVPLPPPRRGDTRAEIAQLANKLSAKAETYYRAPLLSAGARRETLEKWLSWADPNGRVIDWEDPEVSEDELWGAIKKFAESMKTLEDWTFGYNDDLSTFAAVLYPDVPGRTLLLVMTGEEGETPQYAGEAVYLALLELNEDAADWEEVHAAGFDSATDAAYAVATDPKWGIA